MKNKLKHISGHTFIDCIDRDSIIVDLGACIGGFSKALSRRIPFSKMILVEADPFWAKKLKPRFKSKKFEVLNAAAGSEHKEEVSFYISESKYASYLNKDFSWIGSNREKGLKQEIKIKMITMEDIFSTFGLEKIDLLKIDIEGGEWELLENFNDFHFKKINQIAVEFHDFQDPSFRRRTENCIRLMEKLGYSMQCKGNARSGAPYYDCLFYKEELKDKKVSLLGKIEKSIKNILTTLRELPFKIVRTLLGKKLTSKLIKYAKSFF